MRMGTIGWDGNKIKEAVLGTMHNGLPRQVSAMKPRSTFTKYKTPTNMQNVQNGQKTNKR